MSGPTVEVRAPTAGEHALGRRRMTQTFRYSEDALARYSQWPLDAHRVVCEDGQYRGGLVVQALAQRFGGRPVACACVFGVQIAPERRGLGLGRRLFAAALAEWRAAGVGLATLYPSDPATYRKLGWEFAGDHTRYRVPVVTLTGATGPRMIEATADDLPQLDALYRDVTRCEDGALVRSESWWRFRILDTASAAPPYCYVLREPDGRIGAYVVYYQRPSDEPAASEYDWDLDCREAVWRDARGRAAVVAFLAAQRPAARQVLWTGGAWDPIAVAFCDGSLRIDDASPWMTRLVHLPNALEARGYPAHVTGEVLLSVHDDLCPTNTELLRLTVRDGRGTVERASGAAVELAVSTMSAVFTGWLRARDAVAAGLLAGTAEQIDLLERVFPDSRSFLREGF